MALRNQLDAMRLDHVRSETVAVRPFNFFLQGRWVGNKNEDVKKRGLAAYVPLGESPPPHRCPLLVNLCDLTARSGGHRQQGLAWRPGVSGAQQSCAFDSDSMAVLCRSVLRPAASSLASPILHPFCATFCTISLGSSTLTWCECEDYSNVRR